MARLEDSWQIPAAYLQLETTEIVLRDAGSGVNVLLAGLADEDLRGQAASGSGFAGVLQYDAGSFDLRYLSEVAQVSGSDTAIAALRGGGLVQLDFTAGTAVSASQTLAAGGLSWQSADALTTLEDGADTYAVAAYGARNALALFQINGAGDFVHRQNLEVGEGLWIDRPGGLAAITGADGVPYVVLAASGSSSLTVLQLDAGRLVPVSHLLDDRQTRFRASEFRAGLRGGRSALCRGRWQAVINGLSILALLPGGTVDSHVDVGRPATASLPV